MKTIFIDWDHTLFDTEKLKKAVALRLKKLGVPEKLFFKIFKETIGYTWKKVFKPEVFLKILQKHVSFSLSDGKKAWNKALIQSRKFLFPDAIKFLEVLQKRKFRIILVTFGDIKLQKAKVRFAKIGKYFDKIIYTKNKKPKIIKKVLKTCWGKAVFVNDNIEETIEIKKQCPGLQIIIKKVKGKRQPPPPKDFLVFNNLKQIANYL